MIHPIAYGLKAPDGLLRVEGRPGDWVAALVYKGGESLIGMTRGRDSTCMVARFSRRIHAKRLFKPDKSFYASVAACNPQPAESLDEVGGLIDGLDSSILVSRLRSPYVAGRAERAMAAHWMMPNGRKVPAACNSELEQLRREVLANTLTVLEIYNRMAGAPVSDLIN